MEYDLGKLLFTFAQQGQKTQETIETLQQQVRDLTTAVQLPAFELQRERDALQRLAENERQEREKLLLRLGNALLRHERRLPSAKEGEAQLGPGEESRTP